MKPLTSSVEFIIALCAGIAAAAGFAPLYWWPITFVAWSAFLYLLLTRKEKVWRIAFAFGFGTGAVSMGWIVHALAIDNMFLWAIPFAIVGFGLFFGIFSLLAALPVPKAPTLTRKLIAFAIAWTLAEMLRAVILTGFPWNLLGSIWTNTPAVLQIASVGGVYGLSFLSILVFGVPVLLYSKKRMTSYAILCVALLAVSLGQMRLIYAQNNALTGIKVRLVQPNIPQSLKWNKDAAVLSFEKLIQMSRSPAEITHILWPEASVQFYLPNDEDAREMTIHALKQGQTLIAGTLRITPQNNFANSIVILDDLGSIKGIYDKAHLVPFGEYVPLAKWLPLRKIVPIPEDVQAGQGIKTIRIPNAPPAGLLICYEGIFPKQVVDASARPKWLIIATNDAWFGNSFGPHQHLAAAQLRAVEEGLPIVRVANSGISAVIDPYGRVLNSLPLNTQGVLDSEVPLALEVPPPFARCSLSILVSLLLSVLLVVLFMPKDAKL